MTPLRSLALATVGLGILLPSLVSAQRVSADTPRSVATRLADEARQRELQAYAVRIAYGFMGAPAPAIKRDGPKADYYQAWASRIHDRTFPLETLPQDAYIRAVERRLSMPAPPKDRFGVVGSETTTTLSRAMDAKGGGPSPDGPPPNDPPASAGLWELIGPKKLPVPYTTYYGPTNSITTGRIGGIAFDPTDPNTIYMTGASGGVFKTTNGGTNWMALGNGFVYPYVGPIAVSPLDPKLVIVGTGDFPGGTGPGFGLYRSVDGGASFEWVARDTIRNVSFTAVVFDASTPGRVLATAANSSANGLWESLDSGLTWNRISVAGSTTLSLTGLSVGPVAPNGERPMVATCNSGTDTYGFYSSRDAGRTWTRSGTYPHANLGSGRLQVVASPTDPNVAYIVQSGQRKVYRGVRDSEGVWAALGTWFWTDITAGFPNHREGTDNYNWSQSGYDMHISAAPHTVNGVMRDTVYVGLITVAAWNGATWTDIGRTYYGDSKTHNDQHCFAVSPSDPTKMAIGNDGGIYGLTISANGTHTIDPRTSGDTSLAMFYTGAWHPTDPNRMIGGTQDNASPTAIGDLANWVNRTGGDGCGVAIDFQNPNRQYGSAQRQVIYGTTNAWQNGSNFLRSGWPEGMPFVGRMATDRSPQGYLYIGGSASLFRFDPASSTWTDRIGGSPFNSSVRAIAPAPSDPNTIYVGTTTGGIYVTEDRAATWRAVEVNGGLGSISGFSVHPTRPYELLVTTGGGTHAYRYADTRTPNPARTSIAGAGGGELPNIFASSITRHADRPDTDWFVATDVGVFGTVNAGSSWFNMTEPLGLPPVEATTIEHTPGTGYLNVATYGRGMWRLKLDTAPATATLKLTGTVRRATADTITINISVRNVGGAAARQVRVTQAFLKVGISSYAPLNPLPVTLGRIEPGATDVQTITYRNAALIPGKSGAVSVRLEWVSGTENIVRTLPLRVILP